jgi:hypothetical protein
MKTKNNLLAAIAMIALSSVSLQAEAKGHSSGSSRSYGGGKHTTSHGGHYQGGSGKSHQGGHYKNDKTDDQYG